MKQTKKTVSLLAAILLVALLAVPVLGASAYTPVTLDATTGKFTFAEKLYVTEEDSPVPTVTYSYAVDGTIQAYVDKSVTPNVSYGLISTVTVPAGKPAITDSLSFDNNDTLDTTTESGKQFVSKDAEVDLSGIQFTEPGVFFWAVNKTKDNTDSKLTNNREKFFIVVRVEDVAGTLTVTGTGLADKNDDGDQPAVSDKFDHIEDEYSGKTHKLSFEKAVTGNQGSKNRYFQFKLTIENAAAIKGTSVTVDTSNGPGTAGAELLYGETANYTNPTAIAIDATGKGEAVYWLKHGESISVDHLLEGVRYTLEEVNADTDGYTAASEVTGDDAESTTGSKVIDDSLDADASVKFTNNKEGTIPTGLLLQIGAPLAGIALVIVLFLIVFISKRRREDRGSVQ